MPRLIKIAIGSLGTILLVACAGCASHNGRLSLSSSEPEAETTIAHHDHAMVGHVEAIAVEPESRNSAAPKSEATLTLNGQQYRLEPQRTVPVIETATHPLSIPEPLVIQAAPVANGLPSEPPLLSRQRISRQRIRERVEINLPSAMAMVGGSHPAVGFAQWRVQQAYARLDQAKVLWLPTLQAGFSFHRHDGNYQASDARIVDVNRNSFQYGLGVYGTGAGTTPMPGLVAQFHLADAIFMPKIERKNAWAEGHRVNAVVNEQLMTVATTYLTLLEAYQDQQILIEAGQRTRNLQRITIDAAEAGQGLQADADRLRTETLMVEHRIVETEERIEVTSALLAEALSTEAGQIFAPLDLTVIPIQMVAIDGDPAGLIQTGLANRPELKESQALVAAACDEYRRQKASPFIPSLLLGFSTGGFGGGESSNLGQVDGRYDFDAVVAWRVRNLGLGEKASRREAAALVQQAKFEKVRVMDRVAGEVSRAVAEVRNRARQIELTQQAITVAEASYERNLNRIMEGQGLPLEVLQSVRALEDAHRAYLAAVISHNSAQFRLQWALGWPVHG